MESEQVCTSHLKTAPRVVALGRHLDASGTNENLQAVRLRIKSSPGNLLRLYSAKRSHAFFSHGLRSSVTLDDCFAESPSKKSTVIAKFWTAFLYATLVSIPRFVTTVLAIFSTLMALDLVPTTADFVEVIDERFWKPAIGSGLSFPLMYFMPKKFAKVL